jgi:hypothetical protein
MAERLTAKTIDAACAIVLNEGDEWISSKLAVETFRLTQSGWRVVSHPMRVATVTFERGPHRLTIRYGGASRIYLSPRGLSSSAKGRWG